MKRIRWSYLVAAFLLLLIVPVLVTQLVPQGPRHFDRTALEDTRYEEISFRNTAQQLQLGGLLFAPQGEGPFPAVVVIHGSGTSRRDSGWYLKLTQYLQQNGIAVLLPDKRGSEKSEGNWRTADFHDLATDTLAGVEYLKNRDPIAVSQIGIVGMSQGGWIAPIVASQSDDIDFVVTLVGSAVTPAEQLVYEENYNIRQMGFLPGFSNVLAHLSSAHIRYVRMADWYDPIAEYDPIPLWQVMSVEALVLYGRDDTNVPSVESAARLRDTGNANIEVVIYDGSGHALEDPVGQGDSIIRDEVLTKVSDFIHRVAGKKRVAQKEKL